MTAYPSHFRGLRRVAFAALMVEALAALGVCGYGVDLLLHDRLWLGLAVCGGGVAALVLGVLLYCQVVLIHKVVNTSLRGYEAALDTLDLSRRQMDYARTTAENTSLSDWARKVVYREKDYEFLRDSIHGSIVRQDWEAAEHLIRDVSQEFGYGEEAERFRQEFAQAREATEAERVASAIAHFEKLCDARKWEQAARETQRLQAAFDNEPRIAALSEQLETRRQAFKRSLLKEYDEAVRAHDVSRAHRLLYELDTYLSPNEGAALKDSARGVFKAKLFQMGVQFSLAASDKKFADAIDVGHRLMREFPNSRYAREIANMMPALRQRATQETGRDGSKAGS